jgi:hypothetical protein
MMTAVTSSHSVSERLEALGIMSPVDPDADHKWKAPPRLDTLVGKCGGFLANKKANAEVLLKDVKDLMQERYGLGEAIMIDKYIYSRPASEEIIESLANDCDFVVTAIAD